MEAAGVEAMLEGVVVATRGTDFAGGGCGGGHCGLRNWSLRIEV